MADVGNQQKSNFNENLYKDYEFAISLFQYRTGLLWEEFGAFLIAETVLLGFLGSALTGSVSANNTGPNSVVIIGSIFGLIISVLWLSTFKRNYDYYLLRIHQTKRVEDRLGLSFLEEGRRVSERVLPDQLRFKQSLARS